MGAASDDEGLNGKEPPRKRPRKSRSRGLRARTGCLTCRARHKKCGEEFPVCESCRVAGRECVYGADRPSRGSSAGDRVTPPVTGLDQVTHRQSSDESNTAIAQDQVDNTQQHSLPELQSPQSLSVPPAPQFSNLRHDGPSPTNPALMACIPEETSYPGCTQSPGTSHSFTADGASTRWLDLLAFDAAQADEAFSLVSSPRNEPATKNANSISTRGLYQRLSVLADVSVTSPTSAAEYGWREHQDIVLSDQEAILFRNFAEHAALWLDLLDPERHFSTYATRLALRNIGLMKAILALASRHDALRSRTTDNFTNSASGETNAQAIQYYYETLHYVQTALHSPTYTHSEEILATAIIISTYEMLDESASGWQRHLKGVFWIQRSQDVDGESGGLRQSVWWAWLRQDIWAAFREKRKCYSFWVPTRAYANMTQHDLATRAIYNLSKAVNYSAGTATNPYGDPASLEPEVLLARKRAGQELLGMLETWHMYLGPGFRPLPCPNDDMGTEKTPFTPIWIHPPSFAVAIMLYNFAKILITLHLPPEPGFSHHLKTQRALSDCVAAICGIALALRDEGCQIITARCLYGAGLCVQDPTQRNAIISLIQGCDDRTGWPMSTLRNDLLSEWQKVDQA